MAHSVNVGCVANAVRRCVNPSTIAKWYAAQMVARIVAWMVVVLLLTWAHGRSSASGPDNATTDDIARAAKHLLDSLTLDQHKIVRFDFGDAERRDWSNLPVALPTDKRTRDLPPPNDSHARKGLLLDDMDDRARMAVHDLLRSSLSSQGYAKLAAILKREMPRLTRVPDRPYGDFGPYYVDIFGQPGGEKPWGWQFEGHHLALNLTVANGKATGVPAFWGASPDLIRSGPEAGFRALGYERAKGFALVQTLNESQRRKAVLSSAVPEDIFAGPQRDKALQHFEGLPASSMTSRQQELLWSLINEYVNNQSEQTAREHRGKIAKDGIGKVHFAWMGPTEDIGKSVYYRVHGPSILIEYDNTRTPNQAKRAAESKSSDLDSNHIHTIVRDPSNDYGEDQLKKHYQTAWHSR